MKRREGKEDEKGKGEKKWRKKKDKWKGERERRTGKKNGKEGKMRKGKDERVEVK